MVKDRLTISLEMMGYFSVALRAELVVPVTGDHDRRIGLGSRAFHDSLIGANLYIVKIH